MIWCRFQTQTAAGFTSQRVKYSREWESTHLEDPTIKGRTLTRLYKVDNQGFSAVIRQE